MERGRGDGEEGMGGLGGGGGGAAGGGGPAVDVSSGPGKDIVDSLVSMGIGREVAEMAVRETNADTVESAIAWVFENQGDAALLQGAGGGDEGEEDEDFYLYKMVFVVNMELPMTPGKMAAQVGHAAISLYQDLVTKQDVHGASVLQWNENGAKKIVLQGTNAAELSALGTQAERIGLPFTIIQDAGHTQIPAGSQTVLGIFGLDKEVDKVTGTLRLFP